jgi:hypothetical protein
MSFWDLGDGSSAADNPDKEYEIPGGGDMTPIPGGSSVLALIDEAKWDDRNEAEYINLRWSIMAPDEYKNRKVFQKLWVTDDDPNAKDADKAAKKRDKAKRMLAAIDANAGGKLGKKGEMPTDDSLTMCLTNKPMIISLQVWSMPDREQPGEKIEGNWVSAVAPKSKGVDVKAAPAPKPKAAPPARDLDDEIPF